MKIENCVSIGGSGTSIPLPELCCPKNEFLSIAEVVKFIRPCTTKEVSILVFLDNGRVLSVNSKAFTVVYTCYFND